MTTIITLKEPSDFFESKFSGRFRKVKRGGDVVYVVEGDLPEREGLPAGLQDWRACTTAKSFKLASRDFQRETSIVKVGDVEIGGARVVVCAGPCAVEGHECLLESARAVKNAGARILRGGAFKPRTSPYAFQGMGREGLELLRKVSSEAGGMPILTEVTAPEQIPQAIPYVDALQIGARNMQNFELLKAAGRSGKPVVLKRGPSSTIEEWLLSAEYILLEGNWNVILCERGIRTFETATRNVFDLAGLAYAKTLTHLPIIADPSHATGRRELIGAASRAAVAVGADGLLIEVHPRPEVALSDGPQSLRPTEFEIVMREVRKIAEAVGRQI